MIERLGGIQAVQSHVHSITDYLYNQLSNLQHSNGRPMLRVFGKHHYPNAREVQGGILNFEMLRPDGSVFSYKTFEREAAEAGFHVRTGAECNPGACYNYLGVEVGHGVENNLYLGDTKLCCICKSPTNNFGNLLVVAFWSIVW